MATQWYFGRDGQQQGPVSSEQLKELATSGAILPTDVVWKEGMSDWAPASRIKGLFPDRISSEPGVNVSAIGEQAVAVATSGVKKAFGWLSDNLGVGKVEKQQRMIWLSGNWQPNDGSPTLTFTPESYALRSNRYTLVRSDGLTATCEFDPKELTLAISLDSGTKAFKVMSLTPQQLVIASDQGSVVYAKVTSEQTKQAVESAKNAADWVFGFGGLREQQRILQLCASWEPVTEGQPSLLITADDPNRAFRGGKDSVGVHRSDGVTARGVFLHKEMMLKLRPETGESITVKVISLNPQELVLSWHDGVAHYRRKS